MVPRWGYRLALAEGTATGGVQAFPFFKGKAASLTNRGLHPEPGRSGDMLEVIEGFFLANAEELRDFPQIKRPAGERLRDLLPYR